MKKVNEDTGEVIDSAQIRPFADWLREQSEGNTHDELSEGLHDLIDRVRETGKTGRLIFTVVVAPLKDDTNVLVVTDEIKLRLPEFARKSSIFYADDHGNLTRKDPRQLSFDSLRDVSADEPTTPAQLKDATS